MTFRRKALLTASLAATAWLPVLVVLALLVNGYAPHLALSGLVLGLIAYEVRK